jgi:DNA polymerase III delta prime subunit
MLRNEISEFASSVSFNPGRKFVLLDEADNASHLFQPALRAFIEEYSSNCGFIMTANYPNKIIEPLRSRFVTINFSSDNEEKKELIKKAILRCIEILKNEKIEFEIDAIKQLVIQKWPDLRSVINLLQRFSVNGKIDMSVTHTTDSRLSTLLKSLKDKNFTDVRKWVSENSDVDFTQFIDDFYRKSKDFVEVHSIPQVVLTLANYDYKNSFVSNKELNMLAMLTEIMSEVDFK